MSSTPKKRLFWIVLAAFCGIIVWWVSYLPYDEGAVLRAMPADAAFVSVHDNVAARWPDICGSSLIRCLALSAGVKTQEIDEIASDPETIKWINKLVRKRVAVAYVPSLNGSGREAWLVASWVGGYGQRLKWMASLGLMGDDVKRGGMCGRQRIWTMPLSGAGNQTLSVAASDGVLMCCISAMPEGVRSMVDTFDGGNAPAHMPPALLSSEASTPGRSTAQDRGWAAYGRTWPPCSIELDALGISNSCGRITTRFALSGGAEPLKTGDLAESLGAFLGDAPEIVSVFRLRQFLQILRLPGVPAEAKFVTDVAAHLAGDTQDSRMFLCLFGGKYRARITSVMPEALSSLLGGIPVPVVMCGIEVDDPQAARRAVVAEMDRLNADYGLGIIAQTTLVGDETVTAIEGTGTGDYSKLATEERVAYTVSGRWLIFSSNVEVLSQLVARSQGEKAKKEASAARWLKGLRKDGSAAAYAWSDLAAAGVTLKDAMALWRLSMRSAQTSADRRLRRTIGFAMEWMDAIRSLQCGYIGVASSGAYLELHFVQGE